MRNYLLLPPMNQCLTTTKRRSIMEKTIREQYEELEFVYTKYHRMLAFCSASEYHVIRKLEEEALKKLCAFEAQNNFSIPD